MIEDDLVRAGPAGHAAAAGIALHAGEKLDPRAAAYLEEQTRLARLQIENLVGQNAFEVSHLRWRRFNDQMKGVLQLSLALIGGVIAVAIVAALWNAHKADGVAIEAFSVPPDLTAKGVTGQVVAAQLQDKIAMLQTTTFSYRAPASYANNWGDDIKVQIPDTGVSIGEFNRYLRQWLGHETHITGEIWRTPTGVAVAARAGNAVSPTFAGTDADLPKLIGHAAEAIYRSTQPYRYAIYALQTGRYAEARSVLAGLSRDYSSAERAWAHLGLARFDADNGDDLAEMTEFRRAIAEQHGFSIAYNDLASSLQSRGHDEEALAYARTSISLGAGEGDVAVNPAYAQTYLATAKSIFALATGDPLATLEFDRQIRLGNTDARSSWETAYLNDLGACGLLHDKACLKDTWARFDLIDVENPITAGFTKGNREGVRGFAEQTMGDWTSSAVHIPLALAAIERAGKAALPDLFRERSAWPALAVDYANLGDLVKAKALIAKTPLDCTFCLYGRGVVAELSGDRRAAAVWFGRADAFAPSFPFVPVEWGHMLLATGARQSAISKFEIAARRSPRFADPLEGWGEALMAQNRSDLALAKFGEANKYAPNWGRLHLKWGEALRWCGDKAGAQKQFVIATHLDLSAADKATLARVRAMHG